MEDTYSGNEGTGKNKRGRPKKNYMDNKDIIMIKNETPITTPTLDEYYKDWMIRNRKEFFNSGKKSREFIDMVYKVYNHTFNTNKSRGKCGICDWNIILDLKKRYFE